MIKLFFFVICEIIMIVVPILQTSKEYNTAHIIITMHIMIKFRLFFMSTKNYSF